MKHKTHELGLIFAAVLFANLNPFAGCGHVQRSDDSNLQMLAGQGLTWKAESNAPLKLVVCWENPAAANPESGELATASGALRREWVRLALKQNWERHARIVFTGWGTCQDEYRALNPPHTLGPRRPGIGDENLKILITNTGQSQNAGHGSWGDHQKSGIRLNLHCTSGTNADLKSCITYLATHEFGHALGFYHEEERNDWPTNIPGCPKQTHDPANPWWPVPTPLTFGAPDRDSVMAYCSGQPQALTAKDAISAQILYGRHLPGTLISPHSGLCVSSHASEANGTQAFAWECDEAKDDQEWHFDAKTQALFIQEPRQPTKRRCLDGDTVTNRKVQTWDCNQQTNQQWNFHNTRLMGYGNLCLRAVGNRVETTSCETNPTTWEILPAGESGRVLLKIGGQETYLTASLQAGEDAQLTPRSRSGQEFALLPGGALQIPSTQLCLDVRDVRHADLLRGSGGPRSGLRLQSFHCLSEQSNQKFFFNGMIRSRGLQRCLTRDNGLSANGVAIVLEDCFANRPENKWDYIW